MKHVLIFLVDGFEEIEALAVADILRRGNVDVKLIAVDDSNEVIGTHNIKVVADNCFGYHINLNKVDMIVLPGGGLGTDNLKANKQINALIKDCVDAGKYVAAICAAPSVLGVKGLLKGKKVTCYPGFESQLIGAECVQDKVVVDGNIITSKGPGTSFEFAFTLLEILQGRETADKIKKAMQY